MTHSGVMRFYCLSKYCLSLAELLTQVEIGAELLNRAGTLAEILDQLETGEELSILVETFHSHWINSSIECKLRRIPTGFYYVQNLLMEIDHISNLQKLSMNSVAIFLHLCDYCYQRLNPVINKCPITSTVSNCKGSHPQNKLIPFGHFPKVALTPPSVLDTCVVTFTCEG